MISGNAGTVVVLQDLEAVSREAAECFIRNSRESIASRGRFAAALSGGSTPRKLYTLLGSDEYRDRVEWKKTHLFWADERIVPPDHPDSNYRLAYETFIASAPLPPGNIHRIRGEADAETAAREYEQDIRGFFGEEGLPAFDLIMLGIGADGHTASLFPGSDALDERERIAVPVFLGRNERDRVTLTLPVLNNARSALILAAGAEKADVLRDILGGRAAVTYPAGQVRPARGNIRWLIDSAAASKLRSG